MDFQTSNIADVEKEFHCAVDDSLNKAVEKAIAVYLSDGRANDINKDIKELVKMR